MKKLILLGLISAFANCNETDAMRKFERLESSLRERLPFATNKLPSSSSKIFERAVYDHSDKLSMVCAFPDSGKVAVAVQIEKKKKGLPIFLVMQQGVSTSFGLKTLLPKDALGKEYSRLEEEYYRLEKEFSRLQFVSIPDSVEELCEACFYKHRSISRVVLGLNSSLKLIHRLAFYNSGLSEIHIPDGVEEIGDRCFYECKSLSRVTFGEKSQLKCIEEMAFFGCAFSDIYIPASVQKLGNHCFSECNNLIRVYFSGVTNLEHVGICPFQGCNAQLELDCLFINRVCEQCFEEGGGKRFLGLTCGSSYFKDQFDLYTDATIMVRDSIEKLDDECFFQYKSLKGIIFGEKSELKSIGIRAFAESNLVTIDIPDSVQELGQRCFARCRNLDVVNFGEYSSLCKISEDAFIDCPYLREIHIPNKVERIPSQCFCRCGSLFRVTFGDASSLRYIGPLAFDRTALREIEIPDSVKSIGKSCFNACERLSRVMFGENSNLQEIKKNAFFGCNSLVVVQAPGGLRMLIRQALGPVLAGRVRFIDPQ